MKISPRSAARTILPLLALFLCADVFAAYFVGHERYIYFWDSAGYWTIYRDLCELLAADPSKFFWTVVHSIRGEDYNALPVLPLIPFRFLIGEGRMQYVLLITTLYFTPAAVLFYLIFRKMTLEYSEKPSPLLPVISLLTMILLPQFWLPVLVGWPDVAGVAVIGVILLIVLSGPVEKQALWRLCALGFLLCLLVLTRRWYTYWAVTFLGALGLERLMSNAGEYGLRFRRYLPTVRNISLVAIVFASLFVLGATPIAKKMLVTRYADIFSAYKGAHPAMEAFRRFGLCVSLFCSAGVVLSMLNRKTRPFAFFLLVQFIGIFFLFTSVQNFDHHHYYLLVPAIVIFMSFFVSSAYSYLKTRPGRAFFLGAYTALLVLNFTYVLVPGAAARAPALAILFSETRYHPLVRNDLAEIGRLKKVLQGLIEKGDDAKSSVYILSSSLTLNDDILRNASRDDRGFYGRIARTGHVDKRDGFPNSLLKAKYVVVTEPVGYSLRPSDQRIIGVPAQEIIEAKGIGTSFERLPYEFILDGDVRVHIYEKKRPFREEDLRHLAHTLLAYYPGREETFRIVYSSREILRRPPKPETRVRVNYGGKVELRGVTVSRFSEGQLLMSYYWKFLEEIPSYEAFVHFKDADNRILFQDDHFLYDPEGGDEYRGKFVKETYVVDVPHSAYGQEISIAMGIFAPDLKGERLAIESSRGMRTYEQNTGVIIRRLRLEDLREGQ